MKHNLTLNGITGIIFGIFSIIFSWFIKLFLTNFSSGVGVAGFLPISFFEIILGVISLLFILISYFTVVLINKKRRKKIGLKGWDSKAKKIRKIFLALLLIGGIITLLLVKVGHIKLIIPTSLFLYGISSIVVKKYTVGNTILLGTLFILNGLLAMVFTKQLFMLWGMAFGVYHIIYGSLGFFKNQEN
ncbi:DUF3810 domain-containing protein [Lutibacter flavus]|uniref:Uncharacterized protein n=1 Tax=Lutibacter flavus TaxID=691689 RepID=A0A238Z2S5_9FLAO|nr:DUF3810 domain-containing protein [Lutibacter flavus]SNR77656.1 hypothetical protein SAMN04488111_3040 [Lutibacter flavus]